MKVYESPTHVPCVLTWGVFDGVHRGHQRVLLRTISWAREKQLPAVVLTFRQHPGSVICGSSPPLVTSLQHRLLLMRKLGLDAAIVIDFDRGLAETTAEHFVKDVLIEKIGAQGLILGFNCTFGKNAAGDYRVLERIAAEQDVPTREVPPAYHKGRAISSTAIRKAIMEGNLELASEMLGRPASLFGTVVAGAARGKKLGFPTANLELHHEIHPPPGVYLCFAYVGAERLPALTSIGTRPTFNDGIPSPTVEVHIIDFSGDLYGSNLEVEVLEKVREQIGFGSPEQLAKRIGDDVASAREKFASQS